MNPLSSIRQFLPGLNAGGLNPADQVAGGGSSIPAAELRALNASQPGGATTGVQGTDTSFGGMLERMVSDVNSKQGAATQALQDLQSGQNVSLHQAMITMEEASVSFQLMVEVRNRLLDSYQEIMRMQV